jgi:predicted PurR-regulated permease PerM
METPQTSIPRIPIYILGFCAIIAILYIAQDIIIPLVFAGLISIMLSSMVKRLVNKGINRILAVTLTVLPAIAIFLLLSFIFVSQLTNFADAFPKLLEKFKLLTNQGINWGADLLNTSPKGVKAWLTDAEKNVLDKSGSLIGTTIATMGNTLVSLFLIPVYIFMMLYYQPILIGFIMKLFGYDYHDKVKEILPVTKDIIKSYLIGLMIETAIVAALNSIGLLLLGIEYAVLLGIMGGLLNVIPYLGAVIAASLFFIVALVTKSPTYSLLVIVNYIVIQFIDNNFLVPRIIGSKVSLNAFVSIVAVICGGALWGIPGMFLSIPIIALIKVICDRVDDYQAWGYLLGDNMPENRKNGYFKRLKKRKSA